jgi:hypothetical protein
VPNTCEHGNEFLGSIQSNEALLASQEGLCSIKLVSYVYVCTLFIVYSVMYMYVLTVTCFNVFFFTGFQLHEDVVLYLVDRSY